MTPKERRFENLMQRTEQMGAASEGRIVALADPKAFSTIGGSAHPLPWYRVLRCIPRVMSQHALQELGDVAAVVRKSPFSYKLYSPLWRVEHIVTKHLTTCDAKHFVALSYPEVHAVIAAQVEIARQAVVLSTEAFAANKALDVACPRPATVNQLTDFGWLNRPFTIGSK